MIQANDGDQRSFCFGKKVIDYSLLISTRKTLEISVYPDQSIIVKAPAGAEISEVEIRLKKRAPWIFKQLEYFKQFEPRMPKKSCVSGETHLYLGRNYRLKIIQSAENKVNLTRGQFLILCSEEPDSEIVRKMMADWYLKRATVQFNESLNRCWKKFRTMGLKKPCIKIRHMKKRWGSLSNPAKISLNPELIKASKDCLDYVVTHELCHLIHHDHSPAFYRLLSSIMPNWQKIKAKLETSLA
jgi:predicted metal-dependent hydrolase